VNIIQFSDAWQPLSGIFGDAVSLAVTCTNPKDERFVCQCICIMEDGMAASDDSQVILVTWPETMNVSAPFLIRSDSAKALVTMGAVEFAETSDWVHFRNAEGLVVACRKYMEDFPDVASVLAKSGEPAVLPKGLADAVAVASVFSSDNAEDDNLVTVALKDGTVTVSGVGAGGSYAESRDMEYAGPPIKFKLPPSMLKTIVTRFSACEVTEDYLKVSGEIYTYLTALS
jgi:hypothetical protein